MKDKKYFKELLEKFKGICLDKKTLLHSIKGNKNNQIIVVGIVVALITVLGGIGSIIYKNYSNNNVTISKIKTDLYGQSISFGNIEVKLSKDNLKSLKIEDKNVFKNLGFKTYIGSGSVEIKSDKYSIKAPIDVSYVYNDNNRIAEKGWLEDENNITTNGDRVIIKIDEKINEDKVKELLVGQPLDDEIITEEMINLLVFEESVESKNGTQLDLIFKDIQNGVLINKEAKYIAEAIFNGEVWSLNNVKKEEAKLVSNDFTGEISSEKAIKQLKIILGETEIKTAYNNYKFFIEPSEIVEVSNLKVEQSKYQSEKEEKITGFINTKNNKFESKGNVIINIQNGSIRSVDLSISEVNVVKPTEEEIKKSILNEYIMYNIPNKISSMSCIKDTEKNSLKIEEVVQSKVDGNSYYVFGTMSHSDLTDDKVTIKITYNLNLGEWESNDITSSTDRSYATGWTKEALKDK